MDRLPQDIYDGIGALLPGPDFDRPALATVSRQWQMAIERQTFKTIRLRSTDLDRFRDIVRDSRRRYVNKIEYIIILPPYSHEERCRFEREATRRANNEVFTAAIHDLFHLLKPWDACKDGYVKLCLQDVYSSADHDFLRYSSPPSEASAKRWGVDSVRTRTIDLWGWRFRYSFLRLLYALKLPIVPAISSLRVIPLTRNIYDRVPIDMAAKLPSLRVGFWIMNDWEIRYLSLRRTHRHDLAQAVTTVLPQTSALQTLTLNMAFFSSWAPNFSAGTLNSGNSDALGDAIRTATAHMSTLKELRISGTFDESLLWPGPARVLPEPYWQNLEILHVGFSARRTSGGSYFRSCSFLDIPQQTMSESSDTEVPPGYGESEEADAEAASLFSIRDHLGRDYWTLQVVPDDEALEPLIGAFGRACCQMPRLVLAQLSTTIPAPVQLDADTCLQGNTTWGVCYLSPGTLPRGSKESLDPACFDDVHRRRLFWDVMDWRPDMDLRKLLGSIGSTKFGNDLVEKFVDSWSTVRRDQFLRHRKQRRS